MVMVACRECSKEISSEAEACPHCGAKPERPSKPKLWLWIPLGLVGAFLGFGMLASNTPEGKAKAEARRAISLCWEDQQRKSLDSSSQRFIAGACERMEAEFRRRWGSNP